MTMLEHLEHMAYEQDIHIHDYPFSETKKAVCYHSVDGSWEYKAILLDKPKIASLSEKIVLLAEEMGHLVTDSLYVITATANTRAARSNRMKYEAQAKRWAIKEMLPVYKIKACWDKGIVGLYEMAEELTPLPEDFILRAIQDYRSTGDLPQG